VASASETNGRTWRSTAHTDGAMLKPVEAARSTNLNACIDNAVMIAKLQLQTVGWPGYLGNADLKLSEPIGLVLEI
jgi:hypothetical protein